MALEGGSSGLVEKMQNRAKFSGFVTISLPVISLKNCVDEFSKAAVGEGFRKHFLCAFI